MNHNSGHPSRAAPHEKRPRPSPHGPQQNNF
nr:MAG TPA: hypothetical protein [Caudoviricetes sp.]